MRRGFTLVELIIVLAILAVFCMLAIAGAGGIGCAAISEDPDVEMTEYINTLYDINPDEEVKVSCAARDSDRDGYVRCTGTFVPVGDSERQRIEAECVRWGFNYGCVPIKMTVGSHYR
mgnify:CR=1 FL=1